MADISNLKINKRSNALQKEMKIEKRKGKYENRQN